MEAFAANETDLDGAEYGMESARLHLHACTRPLLLMPANTKYYLPPLRCIEWFGWICVFRVESLHVLPCIASALQSTYMHPSYCTFRGWHREQ